MKKILILDADYDAGWESTALMIKRILKNSEVSISRVCKNKFPTNLDYDGFIINGSWDSVYDNKAWIKKLARLVRKIHKSGKPLFGICFGYQIIAYALGGTVVSAGSHYFGYSNFYLTKKGIKDKLFTGLKKKFVCFETHDDCVKKLPKNAVLLANNGGGIQAYRVGNTCAVQFHPEMITKIVPTLYVRKLSERKRAIADSRKYGRPALKIITNFEKMVGCKVNEVGK